MTPCADKTEAGRKSLQKRHGSLNSNLFLSILLQICLRNHFATTTACPRNFWMQLQDHFFEAQLPGIWHCGSIVESCHGWVVVHVLG